MSTDNPHDQSSGEHGQWDDGPAKFGPNKNLTGYEEAIRRIDEAVRNKKNELDLRFLRLIRVPPGIDQLKNLEKLALDNNQFKSSRQISNALSSLTKLSWLDLHSCHLISTPEFCNALSKLKNLVWLNLWNNQLESTPQFANALSGLKNLSTLFIDKNKLTSNDSLASALCKLKSLKILRIDNNQLTSNESLAKALGGLTALSDLGLAKNQLTSDDSLSNALGGLGSLTTLWLRDNPLNLQTEVLHDYKNPSRIIRAIQDNARRLSETHIEIKVVILGEGRIGKTLLRHRLMGYPVCENEPVTQSFEWEIMPDKVEKEVKDGKTQSGTLHLFDFGGQRKLMSSHRFFLSHRRTIYIICISTEESVEQSRLAHWLKFVDDLHEQAARASANQRKADEEKINHGVKHSFEELLEAARQEISRPPVTVVATRSLSEERKLNLKEAQSLCEAHNAEFIKDYDSLDTNPKEGKDKVELDRRVQCVRDAITQAACQDSMNDVWTEQYSKEGLDRREKIKEAFGFGQTGLVPDPDSKYWSIEDYLEFVTEKSMEDLSSEEFVDAIDQLQTLRELGFVHWLGDPSQIAFCDDSKSIQYSTRQHDCLIFSPAWVRGPIYRVLWQEDALGKAIYVNHAISGADLNAYVQNKGQIVSPLYPELDNKETIDVIDLMDRSGLIFKYPDTGVEKYLVPDRLDDSDEKWAGWKAGEARFRMELDFAPDHLMPRLIGELNRSFTCERLTRHSVEITVGDGGYIRVYLDQSKAVLYAGVMIESNDVAAQSIRDIDGYVRTILNRNDVRFEQITVKDVKKHQEGDALDQAIAEILIECLPSPLDTSEESCLRDRELWEEWKSLCDNKLTRGNDPWMISILLGLRCATDSKYTNFSGVHINDVGTTLTHWSNKLKIDLLRNSLCKYANERVSRIQSLTRAWGEARKLLGKDHAYFRIASSPGSEDSHNSRGKHGFTEDDARGPIPED